MNAKNILLLVYLFSSAATVESKEISDNCINLAKSYSMFNDEKMSLEELSNLRKCINKSIRAGIDSKGSDSPPSPLAVPDASKIFK